MKQGYIFWRSVIQGGKTPFVENLQDEGGGMQALKEHHGKNIHFQQF